MGVSSIAYLIQVRMAQARLMLQERELPVADVASAVGYDDWRHFSTLFRARCGLSPSQLRVP